MAMATKSAEKILIILMSSLDVTLGFLGCDLQTNHWLAYRPTIGVAVEKFEGAGTTRKSITPHGLGQRQSVRMGASESKLTYPHGDGCGSPQPGSADSRGVCPRPETSSTVRP